MTRPDDLNSSFNTFLFAFVGTELNGSELTILSTLARLGQDPWAEASRLTKLPKAAAVDYIVESIGRMPLTMPALADARATASRLVQLLPPPTVTIERSEGTTGAPIRATGMSGGEVAATQMRKWVMIAMVGCSLLLGLAANSVQTPAAQQESSQANSPAQPLAKLVGP